MRDFTKLMGYNDRQNKKLSKKLKEVSPELFRDAWMCEETNTWCMGGGVDYWGEGQDEYTCLEFLKLNYEWLGDFDTYPEGHKWECLPDISDFKPTFRSLLRLVKMYKN